MYKTILQCSLLTPHTDGNRAVNSDGSDAVPLVSFQDAETPLHDTMHTAGANLKSKTRLLLFRGSFFVAGAVMVVIGGILSRFHPAGNYSSCQDTSDNSTNFTSTMTVCLTGTCHNVSYMSF